MVDKKKNKPDYTKFMKKPAPLEPIETPESEPIDSHNESSPEEEIPLAEILSSNEENVHEELGDMLYFEPVSTDEHVEIEQSPKNTSDSLSYREPPKKKEKRTLVTTGKSVASVPSGKTHKTSDAIDMVASAHLANALQPPPIPVFIAPILLALMFLAF